MTGMSLSAVLFGIRDMKRSMIVYQAPGKFRQSTLSGMIEPRNDGKYWNQIAQC
jgi:hypothetical protein